jgi:hypothetical protein
MAMLQPATGFQAAPRRVFPPYFTLPQVQQLEKIAQDTAGNLAGKIDAALSPDARGGGGAGGSGTSSGGGDPGTLGRLAAAESAAGRVPLAQDALLALGSKVGGGGASYWRGGYACPMLVRMKFMSGRSWLPAGR